MAAAEKKVVQLKAVEPEAEAPFPEHVVIGPYEYEVRGYGELEQIKSGNLGYCDEGNLVIGIATETSHAQHQAEVMIHEILHGIFGAVSIDQDVRDAHEEEIITKISKAILQVARDNPHVLRWINSKYQVV